MGGVILLISFAGLYIGNRLWFRIDSSLVGFIFFYIGYHFKSKLARINTISISHLMGVILLSVILLITCSFLNNGRTSINACTYGPYPPLFLVSGVSGSILLLSIGRVLSLYKSKIILQISNGMIIVLAFHWMIYLFVFKSWFHSENLFVALIVVVANMAICYLLVRVAAKYCPILLGNRKLD